MYPLKYYLHKRMINDTYNKAIIEINNSDLCMLDGIYNYYNFEFQSIANHLKYTNGGTKRDELLNLIKNNRKEIKRMILIRRGVL